jgi:cyclopropane fatty-acyl-phospholipid synthase-like methyltransferase
VPDALDYSHYYREWHDESDAHFERMSASSLELLAPYLPVARGQSVLEIGCGMGFAIGAMGLAGFKSIRGVDIDTSQVAACKRRGLDVEQISDLESFLSTQEGQFDLIVMLDVLEHIAVSSQINVLRAIHAALRPGGRLIMQVPNATSLLAMRWMYQDFTHASTFTERSIRFALNNANFSKVDVPALENRTPRPSFRPWALLARKNRWYLKRWVVRSAWRMVLEAELPGDDLSAIPLSLNLMAIADKDG